MTVKDILDSVAAHRQPDSNPFMLRSTLAMRLYNDTMTYFSFEKDGFMNLSRLGFYNFNVEKGTDLSPDTNKLLPEQEGRQTKAFVFLRSHAELVDKHFIKDMLEYGRPAYKVDTSGSNPQLHLFFFIRKGNWYMNSFNRKMTKADTAENAIVRIMKLDIDRQTWTVRRKEWCVLKTSPRLQSRWRDVQTYDQCEGLLKENKVDTSTQMGLEMLEYDIVGNNWLVPVLWSLSSNFSPVAGAPLLGKPTLNPERSTFSLSVSNTKITDKPHNPDYHVMRVVSLDAIFKSPFAKEKKK